MWSLDNDDVIWKPNLRSAFWKSFAHSSGGNGSSRLPLRLQVTSSVRSAALRRRCLSLAKTCSIGLRSGLMGGRNNRWGGGGTRLPDRPSDGMSLVAGEIVHHHHVLWCQRRQAETFDIDTKPRRDRRDAPCVINGSVEAQAGGEDHSMANNCRGGSGL